MKTNNKHSVQSGHKYLFACFLVFAIFAAVCFFAYQDEISLPPTRLTANEFTARHELFLYFHVQKQFFEATGRFIRPKSILRLTTGATRMQLPVRCGYKYSFAEIPPESWYIIAYPLIPGKTGSHVYVVDNVGEMYEQDFLHFHLKPDSVPVESMTKIESASVREEYASIGAELVKMYLSEEAEAVQPLDESEPEQDSHER